MSRKLKTILASSLIIPILLVASKSYAQEYSPVTRLGTDEAICVGGIETREQLQAVFVNDSQTIAEILSNAGWQGDKADLDAAIAAGDFVEKSYEPGSRFFWMAAKRKNTGVALPLREWAGKESILGYEVKVTSQCQVHTMVIPKICCNLSLMSMEPEAVADPVVIISAGEETASICTEAGNEMMIIAEDGTATPAPLDANGCWNNELPAGNYVVRTTNPHCSGATSTDTFSVAAAPVAAQALALTPATKTIIPYVAAFGGREARERYEPAWDMYKQDSSSLFGIKFGALAKMNETVSLFSQLGMYTLNGLNEGSDWSSNNVFVDVGVEKQLTETGFAGLGIGLWNVDNNDTDMDSTSWFMYGGGDLADTGMDWFVEARVFQDLTQKISDNNVITFGVRYLFD